MANGEQCRHCGYQETEHSRPEQAIHPDPAYIEGSCGHFESEVPHLVDCPEVGCDGNCSETMHRAKVLEDAAVHGGGGIVVFFLGSGNTLFYGD